MTVHPLWHATLVLDKSAASSIQQQLIAHFRHLITSGLWSPGQLCPSSRTVAQQLQINRKTVSRVYAVLATQGLIYTRAKQGTFVSMLNRPPLQLDKQALQMRDTSQAKRMLVKTAATAPIAAHPTPAELQQQRLFKRIVAHYHHLLEATNTANMPPAFLSVQDIQGPLHLREALANLLDEDRHFKVRAEHIACNCANSLLEALGRFLPTDGVLLIDDALSADEAEMLKQVGHRVIQIPMIAAGRFNVLLEQLEKFAINYPITALWCDSERWLSGQRRHTELAVLCQKLANYNLWLIDDQRRRLSNWLGQSPLAAHYSQSLLIASLYGAHSTPLNLSFIASQQRLPATWSAALQALGPTVNTAMLYAHQLMLQSGDYRQLMTAADQNHCGETTTT